MNEREFSVLFAKLTIKFADIDRKYNLPRGTTRLAISMPNTKGEKALADVLDRPLNFLFPKRYDENNKRLRPQPTHRYWVVEYLDCDLSDFSKEELERLRTRFYLYADKNLEVQKG